jgi:hypothetical protein
VVGAGPGSGGGRGFDSCGASGSGQHVMDNEAGSEEAETPRGRSRIHVAKQQRSMLGQQPVKAGRADHGSPCHLHVVEQSKKLFLHFSCRTGCAF